MTRLNADRIRQLLQANATASIEQLDVFSEIESTNSFLLDAPAPSPGLFRVAVTESQTGGRGRLDRRWFSHSASSICLSLSHTFVNMPRNPSCLTLATGIGIIESLAYEKVNGINLKWPNDLMIDGRKVGGILTEMMSGKPATVVIGVGLNVDLTGVDSNGSDAELIANACDLRTCNPSLPDRLVLVATLIASVLSTFRQFEREGFKAYMPAWKNVDFLRGKQVVVKQVENTMLGIARGIADNGELLLSTSNGTKSVVSGSVRLVDQEPSNK